VFTASDLQNLKYFLMSSPNLKTLDLTGSTLGFGDITQGIVEFAESFDRQKNPTTQFNPTILLLKEIELGTDFNNQNDTYALAAALPQTQLQVLDISSYTSSYGNYLYPELATALPQTLTELTVSKSTFMPGATQAFGERCKTMANLRKLDLTQVSQYVPDFPIETALAEAFQSGMFRPTHLYIDLGTNETAAVAFAGSLPDSIEVLVLDGSYLETPGSSAITQALGQSMQYMQNLQHLSLVNTKLGSASDGEGLRAIGDALIGKASLQFVDITRNTITSDPAVNPGLLAFLNGIADSSHSCIQFNSCPIPSSSWEATGGQPGALDAAYALGRKQIIEQCQSEICFRGGAITSIPACNITGNSSLATFAAYRIQPISATFAVKETSWLGSVANKFDGLLDSIGSYFRQAIEGAPSYFPKNSVVPIYGAQNPYSAGYESLINNTALPMIGGTFTPLA
ncbi:MAG: hypothetical protein WCG04_06765, partial [Alphaproteobacteria bacterium]